MKSLFAKTANNLSFLSNLKLLCRSLHDSPVAPRISLRNGDYSPDSSVARSNWLITKLSREGRINEAREVFDRMLQRDVVTWTTVITGYIKCRLMVEARRLFDRADAVKNVVTWTAMVSGYVRLNRISEAERLFEAMPVKNVVSWNTMIDGYVRCGDFDKALEVFKVMPERNLVSWNAMIAAMTQCGRMEEAKRLFDETPTKDVISWTSMVAGLARNGRVDEAREMFERMPERNVVSWNAMITGYAKNKRLDEAFELFERMPERDLPSWNTMITGCIQNGDLNRAVKLFSEMPERNVVSWTTMVTGYVQEGESEVALKLFAEMINVGGARPNEGTFVNVLCACSDMAGLREGQQVHQMISKSVHLDRAFIVSALIDMYSKCGDLDTVRKMFDGGVASQRDIVAWNCMIAVYAHHGCGREAIKLFDEMKGLGFKPNDVSYVGLLSACSHTGLVDEGLKFFDELVSDRSINVREDHYTCFVDLCGRAGRLREAYDFILQLDDTKKSSSSSTWGALLSACIMHGNLDVGKLASEEILKEEPENAAAYLLLSNLYASCGKWKEASKVRLKMKDMGLKKQPGCSWIEVGNEILVFLARDKSHSESDVIYSLLQDLHAKMRKEPSSDQIVGEFHYCSL